MTTRLKDGIIQPRTLMATKHLLLTTLLACNGLVEPTCFTEANKDPECRLNEEGEQGAYWKSTSTDIAITDLNGKRIGYMRKYTLYEDKDDKRSANWYMEEYRVHDPHELVDPYVLCKIYDKDGCCPKFTETSIQALTKRIIERQHGSHPDQTNSLFDNRNQSQTQFDGSNSHEDTMLQPPSEKSPAESILPTSDNKVFPMLHGLSNEFSMSPDPSGNLNPPESIRPIPRPPGPPDYSYGFSTSHGASGNQNHPESIPSFPWNSNPMNQSQTQSDNNNFVEDPIMQPTESFPSDSIPLTIPRPPGYSNGFSMSHDASGNQNRPEPIPSIPWNSKPMNQFQTQSDNSNFVEDHIMQPTFPTSEDLLSELDRPIPSPLDSYSNEYRYMTDGISNGPSMTHSLPGNPNAVDGEESSLDCFSDQLWNRWNF
ncbi:hypothetical protein MRB53_021498 [Persea americana]|uniref:Uncharacterized protein n=1 Tax=Persea americana TaxID=3435 RepID=A0ACC2L4T3_PERAE|nr:hypothetical protein MRB53_021498 [Persea americana]